MIDCFRLPQVLGDNCVRAGTLHEVTFSKGRLKLTLMNSEGVSLSSKRRLALHSSLLNL